jgi:hypothetical protein
VRGSLEVVDVGDLPSVRERLVMLLLVHATRVQLHRRPRECRVINGQIN